jgi:hypothetical protein
MNPFWNREARLARRLKAERPEPSRQFLSSMMERLDADPVTHRRSFGLRVGLASAVSLAFLTSLAAFGGLGYAATSIAHVGRTATNVVMPQHREHPTQVREIRGATETSQPSTSAATTSAATTQASSSASTSTSARQGSSSNGASPQSNFSLGGGTSAFDQYDLQFVCVLFSPEKYKHIVRLPRFLVPFFLQVHPSAVVVPCPPPRRGRGG